MQTRTDRQLIAAYLEQEDGAFEEFYERHRGPIFAYLLSFVPNRATAEELLQETFLVLLRQIHRVLRPDAVGHRRDGGLRPALVQISRSRAIDWLRRSRLEERALDNRRQDLLFRSRAGSYSNPESPRDAEKLSRQLQRLPAKQRETVLLRACLGMTFVEIGELMDVSENTAVSRFRYGMKKLRNSLVPGACDD